MPKGSPELTALRKEEIINACEKLYKTMSFKEITIKEIGAVTSFKRTSIYNYFQTKEEIFLALMKREYTQWAEEINKISAQNEVMSADEFAKALAHTLENHEQLLKLLAMNHYDMEENSRPEQLTEFKIAYGASIDAVRTCIEKFFPSVDSERFIFVFFPFLFGIYPYTFATDRQLKAMREANMDFKMHSIYEIVYFCIIQLTGDKK